ncbi:isocitrate lyase/PEP mutase family protein [Demequina capsici]|uniref:Isocitrate lyase/PEP mutase family protein n=1 Tax=Demequina capsici TaxID=3075620 RepID=A0AA96J9K6_9MICO|nr:isocitrate lyase/PEP mutase family protein [Demequina sp. OYTSA14]WNM23596.1 isocitrate lyase/PEP mutase family protein [Demequina sp. OYTSA14]
MSRKTTLTLSEATSEGQVLAPYVFDCLTARMAENTGFRTFVVSTSSVSMAFGGVPDMGALSVDDILTVASNVADFLPYPVIAEFENGFGATPHIVWRNVRRLVKTEVAAVIIDDTTDVRGTSRPAVDPATGAPEPTVVSRELFYAKIRAALDACEGTGCHVIAASNAAYTVGLDEAVERLRACSELGADMVMGRGIVTLDDCEALAAAVPGPKVYHELSSTAGVDNVDIDAIADLNFDIVTVRYVEKASLYGLMEFGLRTRADNTMVYVDYHDFDGRLPGRDHHILLSRQWDDIEREIGIKPWTPPAPAQQGKD